MKINRRKNWFYRSLFAYLPIFYIVISILFLIFFVILSENTKHSALKANEALSVQVAQSVDNMLKNIDKGIIKDILTDDAIHRFFTGQDGLYNIYSANYKLNSITASFPEIESIYMVRYSDDLVLSNDKFMHLKQFSDRDFIEERKHAKNIMYWSGKRNFTDPLSNTPDEVVSLVRRVPIVGGSKGIFVVNIRAAVISDMVSRMSSSRVNYLHVKDTQGNFIYRDGLNDSESHTASSKYLSHSTLSYTGWKIESGIKGGFAGELLSTFPYFWAILGLISIMAGSLLIIYVTRRNYKPIESLIERINEIFYQKNSRLFVESKQDEMSYISLAIDNLLENESKFQHLLIKDQNIIRKHLFMELLEGVQYLNTELCREELGRLGIETHCECLSVMVLEIDKYTEFCSKYSERDQFLLKYVLQSVIQEIAHGNGVRIWVEQIDGAHLGIMYFMNADAGLDGHTEQAKELVISIGAKTLHWAKKYLKFTVTIGFGGVAQHTEAVPQLFNAAREALSYKSIVGTLRIITTDNLPENSGSDIFHHVQIARTIARSFRLGEKDWEDNFMELMQEMRLHPLPVDDVTKVLSYLLTYLEREINELPESMQERWTESIGKTLQDLLDHFELLEDFQTKALIVLQSAYEEMVSQRKNSMNNELILNMKRYIEENYANPDLSLNHLSDEFNLSTRYLSKLFKDAFGEKFVDYLVKIRMERAKELLLETDQPVQDVALQVGYLHPFSFIRMFKKVAGTTPGDFRRNPIQT